MHAGGQMMSALTDRRYDVCSTADGKMAAAGMWRHSSQYRPLQQNVQLRQQQPMLAPYMQAAVSMRGQSEDWSRLSGQLPYQQHHNAHHHQRLPQQRYVVPRGAALVRRQLPPTYQTAIDEHQRQDMMLKHSSWRQQRLMHPYQSASLHNCAVMPATEADRDGAGFHRSATGAMMSLTGCTYTPSVSTVTSAI